MTHSKHFPGLDTLRLICAFWVTLNHVGIPDLHLRKDVFFEWALRGVLGSLFNAPAAVIVFFVISGFCIHLPYGMGSDFDAYKYFTRRLTRILIPLFAITLVGQILGVPMTLFSQGILWSIICELIYYCLYPFFRKWSADFGWERLIGISFVFAIGTLYFRTELLNYPESYWTTWILGLPCWLLGCSLAVEKNLNIPVPKPVEIWTWRLGIWFLSSLAAVLRFHSELGYPITLTIFCVPVFFWMRKELAYSQSCRVMRFFENLGKASFSLYLCHLPATGLHKALLNHQPESTWTHYLWIAILTTIFYLLVEKPSHHLARSLSLRLRAPIEEAA